MMKELIRPGLNGALWPSREFAEAILTLIKHLND